MSLAAIELSATAAWSAAGTVIAARIAPGLAPRNAYDPLAAFLLAAAAGVAALTFGAGCAAGIACGGLTAAAILDACSGYLVDELTLSSAFLALFCGSLAGTAPAALAGMASVALPAAAMNLVTRAAWLGWGDVKALLALGAGLGIQRTPVAIVAACVLGLLGAALSRRREIRFGPYLAAGAVVALGGAP